MLKSYEAVYEEGTLRWVREQPPAKRMKVIVTVLEEEMDTQHSAARKAILERTKGCVKPGKSVEEIDADIRQMRDEWEREWDK
ncbi:MAG: hypothetical protein HY913_00950 [Desulfomonile tiedjei]|nr:hypothetical protein [Desulfomonile tiedjei]